MNPDHAGEECGATHVVKVIGQERSYVGQTGMNCASKRFVVKSPNRAFDKPAFQHGDHVRDETAGAPDDGRRGFVAGPGTAHPEALTVEEAIFVEGNEVGGHRQGRLRPRQWSFMTLGSAVCRILVLGRDFGPGAVLPFYR